MSHQQIYFKHFSFIPEVIKSNNSEIVPAESKLMLAYPFHTNSAVLKIITDMRVRGA
jgi:hypothetical protein